MDITSESSVPCLIAPISQHIMLPQSTVATALIFNWVFADESTLPTLIAEDHLEFTLTIIDELNNVNNWLT